MAKDLIGLTTCPECGCERAEIKETKAKLAYRWCPECYAQYFPKKYPQSDRLKETARAGTASGKFAVQEPEPEPEATEVTPQPVPVPEQKQETGRRSVFGGR